jgi:hypothetical protein
LLWVLFYALIKNKKVQRGRSRIIPRGQWRRANTGIERIGKTIQEHIKDETRVLKERKKERKIERKREREKERKREREKERKRERMK